MPILTVFKTAGDGAASLAAMSRIATLSCCIGVACGAQPPEATQIAQAPPAGELRFEISAIDRAADRCADFYAYACGGWLAQHPIPPERSRWSRYAELQTRNAAIERALVEAAARSARTASERRVGAYYAACLDEAAIETRGLRPVRALLDRIDGVRTAGEASDLIAILHQRVGPVLFALTVVADPRDVRRTLATIDLGLLGLVAPEAYTRNDAHSAEHRAAYEAHLARTLQQIGDAGAAASARRVVALETRLARAVPPPAERRDPEKLVNVRAVAELAAGAPGIDWPRYLRGLGAGGAERVNVKFVSYLEAVAAAVADDLPGVRAYLRYQVARAFARLLPRALDAEIFDFVGRTLSGARELAPRWERCLALVDRDLGDDVGQMFVAARFPPESRARARALVERIVATLRRDLAGLDWLGAPARAAAIEKLDHIAFTVGHADRWKRYDALEVRADDPVGNAQRGAALATAREVAKLGAPTDRTEFLDVPQRFHAFSAPETVSVGFTAAFLQPPVFDPAIDDPINFGGAGGVIGHEITHHFDDEGRQYNVDGNLAPWWSAEDVARYHVRAACFVDEYSQFRIEDGTPVDGRLTLGENLADNGGLRLAWDALRPAFDGPPIAGFTPAQRFFLAWAQIRCEAMSPQTARAQALNDPHAPGRWRVNGVVRNMPEFQTAFSCPAGAAMAPAARCRLW
jgi:endothelin-converting enzyme/putative endopeptidase